MDEDHPEWFNTPELTYLNTKKEFLRKFRNETKWGEFGTRKQVIALSSLLEFLQKTSSLADQFPHLLDDIQVENKNMLLKRTIPLPDKLYEQLLLTIVQGAKDQYPSIWEQPVSVTLDKIEEFLERQKSGCLALYQQQVWSKVHSYEYSQLEAAEDSLDEASELFEESSSQDLLRSKADLNKLRSKIYSRIQFRKSVQECILQYQTLTEEFLDRFDSKVTVGEAKSLRKRVRIARNAARASRPKVRTRRPALIRGHPNRKSKYVPSVQYPQAADIIEKESNPDDTDEESQENETGRQNASSHQTDWDHLLLALPEVPYDPDADHAGKAGNLEEDIDDQIKKRLTKLQFFSRAWSQLSENPESSSVPVKPDHLPSEEENDGSETDDFVSVESSEEDRQEFNNWYYAKLGIQTSSFLPSSTIDHHKPMHTTIKATCLTNPFSEHQMADLAISSQTCDTTNMTQTSNSVMTNPLSSLEQFEMSKQQELLDVITNLCYMQVHVITQVIIATILLDRLNMVISQNANISTNKADPALSVATMCVEYDPPCPSQDCDPVTWVTSQGYPDCGTVTPWRRKGIIFTKLF